MARLRLSPFGEGKVFPHEETLSGPKADRLMLMTTTKANLSQIFGLYPDPANEAQSILGRGRRAAHPGRGHGSLGRGQSDVGGDRCERHRTVSARDRSEADFHRRRPPSLRDGLQLPRGTASAAGFLAPEHPANFVLMMFIGMERSRPDRHADPPPVPRPAADEFSRTDRKARAAFHDPRRRRGKRPGSDDLGRNRNRRRSRHARPLYRRRTSAGFSPG